MSETVQDSISNESETAVTTETFERQLFQSRSLQTDSDEWRAGKLKNIQVRPKVTLHGRAYNSYQSGERTAHKFSDMYGKEERIPTETQPFFSLSRRDWPYSSIHLDSLNKQTVIIQSFEDFYACDKTEDIVGLVPIENDDGYFVVSVEFELIGELTTENLLQPQTVCLDTARSIQQLSNKTYVHQLEETDMIDVTYNYSDDTLRIRPFLSESKNWMRPITFNWIAGLTAIGAGIWLWLNGTKLINTLLPIPSSSTIAWLTVLVAFVGFIRYYSEYAIKTAERIQPTITTGRTRRDVSTITDDDATVGRPFATVKNLEKKREQITERATKLVSELQKRPRNVTVSPSSDGTSLKAETRNITWNLSDSEVLDEQSIEFFIEHGFERDITKIETHMIQDKSAIPDHLPALQSTNGDWYLLPEKINFDPILKI